MITVTVQIGKCIYKVEMEAKDTKEEIISEVKAQLEITKKNVIIKSIKNE